jgi:hypothetical protein
MAFTAQADEVVHAKRDAWLSYVERCELDDVMYFLGRSYLAGTEAVNTQACVTLPGCVPYALPLFGFVE